MKKRALRKLTVTRETLQRLEAESLPGAAGGATTTCATFCNCQTDLCITLQYSNCNVNTCNCA